MNIFEMNVNEIDDIMNNILSSRSMSNRGDEKCFVQNVDIRMLK